MSAHEQQALTRIVSLAEAFGLEWIESCWPKWHGPGTLCGKSASDVAHELAHWLVAPRSRKRIKWHGLPFFEEGPCLVTSAYAQREELLASLLGIYIERWAGAEHMVTFYEHNWHEWRVAANNAAAVTRTLRQRGLYPVGALVASQLEADR